MGVVWHAIDEFLTRHPLHGRLVAARLMEHQPHLADAVLRWWQKAGRLGPKVPAQKLGGDVWDLFRHDRRLLQTLLESIPAGSVLLVVGGFPRQ
eukprot:975363-Alexandrium_andersonii.AAC.1